MRGIVSLFLINPNNAQTSIVIKNNKSITAYAPHVDTFKYLNEKPIQIILKKSVNSNSINVCGIETIFL